MAKRLPKIMALPAPCKTRNTRSMSIEKDNVAKKDDTVNSIIP